MIKTSEDYNNLSTGLSNVRRAVNELIEAGFILVNGRKVEYKGRNRHNVECFLERVLYFGWPNQPSSGTMENFASRRVFM